jgi:hypothetical protein
MSSPTSSPAEKRIQSRKRIQLRVDARLITEQERIDILAGLGHPDLDTEGMSLSRPRFGMTKLNSHDASGSGLRLQTGALGEIPEGSALSLDVHLPGEQRVVKLLGDVMWTGEDGGAPVAGLRIAALDQEGLLRLLNALQKAPPA